MYSVPPMGVKSELMHKFLADIPASSAASSFGTPPFLPENLSKSQFENLPKNFSNPLQILTESLHQRPGPQSAENPPKAPENPLKFGENPLFSAALQQLARDTEEKSRNLSPALVQQAQAIQFLAQIQSLLLQNSNQSINAEQKGSDDRQRHTKKVRFSLFSCSLNRKRLFCSAAALNKFFEKYRRSFFNR